MLLSVVVVAGTEPQALPILLYRGIGSAGLRAEDFARHMDALVASRRRPLTISELAAPRRRGEPMPASAAAVTFDDGTADFYEVAWPILRERGLTATVYVTSSLVGRRLDGEPMLTWRQLKQLREAGIEIGSQAHRQIKLDESRCDCALLELVNSRLILQQRLQTPVRSFAYPYGHHTPDLKRLLPSAGYTSACAIKDALSHPNDDAFALARVTITSDTTPERVRELLEGRGAPLASSGEHGRTRRWRLYRRGRALSGR
jgi:peptidoglycan/xylan/chitin deacetylase (PgdA/CDA1 family)